MGAQGFLSGHGESEERMDWMEEREALENISCLRGDRLENLKQWGQEGMEIESGGRRETEGKPKGVKKTEVNRGLLIGGVTWCERQVESNLVMGLIE